MDSEHIHENWNHLIDEVKTACHLSGRNFEDITIIGVSKKKALPVIEAAYHAGCRVFGENYVQEVEQKFVNTSFLELDPEIHFIGALQKNKAKKAVQLCTMIQSVDSFSLANEINKQARKFFEDTSHKKYSILLQVNVSSEAQKNGISPDLLSTLYEEVSQLNAIEVKGLMTIGSMEADDTVRSKEFQLLRKNKESLESNYQISLPYLSMGMSDDFRIAIHEGSNMIRIGSRLFGSR
jgi:PLP dependent protein